MNSKAILKYPGEILVSEQDGEGWREKERKKERERGIQLTQHHLWPWMSKKQPKYFLLRNEPKILKKIRSQMLENMFINNTSLATGEFTLSFSKRKIKGSVL